MIPLIAPQHRACAHDADVIKCCCGKKGHREGDLGWAHTHSHTHSLRRTSPDGLRRTGAGNDETAYYKEGVGQCRVR